MSLLFFDHFSSFYFLKYFFSILTSSILLTIFSSYSSFSSFHQLNFSSYPFLLILILIFLFPLRLYLSYKIELDSLLLELQDLQSSAINSIDDLKTQIQDLKSILHGKDREIEQVLMKIEEENNYLIDSLKNEKIKLQLELEKNDKKIISLSEEVRIFSLPFLSFFHPYFLPSHFSLLPPPLFIPHSSSSSLSPFLHPNLFFLTPPSLHPLTPNSLSFLLSFFLFSILVAKTKGSVIHSPASAFH